jgi:hypothetical protein
MGRTPPGDVPTSDCYSITAEKHDFDGRKAALKELGGGGGYVAAIAFDLVN